MRKAAPMDSLLIKLLNFLFDLVSVHYALYLEVRL